MELDSLWAQMTERKASDLHLAAGVPPIFRINGALVPDKQPNLTAEAIENFLKTALPKEKLTLARQGRDFSATLRRAGETYRCQVVCASGQLTASIRVLPSRIPTLQELGVPAVVEKLTGTKRGLILCVGPTGSGKATTLVSFLEHINMTRSERIVTVEDPTHYVLQSKLSLITQRIVGEDVESYESGLLSARSADADVILVGELRTAETACLALELADAGHLVLSQMTAVNVSDALERLRAMWAGPHDLARLLLSRALQAIIAQRLLTTDTDYRDKNGLGRLPANEILLGTDQVRQLLGRGETDMILVIEASREMGMQTMDDAVLLHYKAGRISRATAEREMRDTRRLP